MTGAVVQARMGSSRLPGKVLLDLAGQPALLRVLDRLERCRSLDTVIVATSTLAPDDAIASLCERRGTRVFRGSESDVLDRYYRAAVQAGLSVIVRITADCPLIDPVLVDEMVGVFLSRSRDFDLVTNRHPLTYPDGLDVDVMSLESLRRAWSEAKTAHQREHVIPYFWEAGLRVHNVESAERLFDSHRWTLDYPEDYELIRRIYEALQADRPSFSTPDVLAFLAEHPDLARINAHRIPRSS
jgi:spore coat polysaccharide biosynthesis protein SpsF